MELNLKYKKPVIAQCKTCSIKYDMVEWGVECPNCRNREKHNHKKN